MARETGIQSQVKSYQRLKIWYFIPPCLTLSIIRYGLRVKWSNPGKVIAPASTPNVVTVEKGPFGLPSTTVANFTLITPSIYRLSTGQYVYIYSVYTFFLFNTIGIHITYIKVKSSCM